MKFIDENGKEWPMYSYYILDKRAKAGPQVNIKLTKEEEKILDEKLADFRGYIERKKNKTYTQEDLDKYEPVLPVKITKSGRKGWSKNSVAGNLYHRSEVTGENKTLFQWMEEYGWDIKNPKHMAILKSRLFYKVDIHQAVTVTIEEGRAKNKGRKNKTAEVYLNAN